MSANFQNEKFNEYFASVYKDRWPQLLASLRSSENQILRKNKYVDHKCAQGFDVYDFKCDFLDRNKNCYSVDPQKNVHNLEDENKTHVFYKMDPASYIVANALEVKPEDLVLDLCAAPGGKTLILAEALNGTGQLVSNEYSNSRRERLLRVVREYLPHEYRQNVFVLGKDGNYYGQHKKDVFDCVLADVPCSGERHLLENQKEFSEWTKRRSENLAVRQYSLLSSAYLACRIDGRIVYSTCSISPMENDDVIAKLIKKRSVEILRPTWLDKIEFIEKTTHGYQILPDRSGFGPMYFSVLLKKS